MMGRPGHIGTFADYHTGSSGKLVRIAGLEPARIAPLPPQSSVSANSTICAHWLNYFHGFEGDSQGFLLGVPLKEAKLRNNRTAEGNCGFGSVPQIPLRLFLWIFALDRTLFWGPKRQPELDADVVIP